MVELRKAVPAWQTLCLGCPLPPLILFVSAFVPLHFLACTVFAFLRGMSHVLVTLAMGLTADPVFNFRKWLSLLTYVEYSLAICQTLP